MVDVQGNSMQIVLVTQDLAQVSAFARQLVETTFHHSKLTAVGLDSSFRIDVYHGPVSGPNPPRQSRLREVFGRFDPAIFKLYKSHTLSQSAVAGANEKAVDARMNVWRRPVIWLGLAGVLVAIVWGVPAAWRQFHPSQESCSSSSARLRLPLLLLEVVRRTPWTAFRSRGLVPSSQAAGALQRFSYALLTMLGRLWLLMVVAA